jgi:hypothetical protein
LVGIEVIAQWVNEMLWVLYRTVQVGGPRLGATLSSPTRARASSRAESCGLDATVLPANATTAIARRNRLCSMGGC